MNSANPFNPCDYNKEWKSNDLILKDPSMRQRAGITVLDHNVSQMFTCEPAVAEQQGGVVFGAPLHLKYYGSKNVIPYEKAEQQGGGFPYHYYTNNRRW